MFRPNLVAYEEPIYRPPSEAHSLLIQLTIGCSHNKCTFCGMYRSKDYRVRTLPEIFDDLEKAQAYYSRSSLVPRKLFLCDGDALGAPMEILVPVLERINSLFPKLQRVGAYATARNILEKSKEELETLKANNLKIAYLGIESGDNDVLRLIVKGNTAEDMLEAGLKIKQSGWKLSAIIMLGAGGRSFSRSHTSKSAEIISNIAPQFFSFLTTIAVPGTPYAKMIKQQQVLPLTTKELLGEMREILKNIDPGDNKIIFRANHVSNQFPLEGILARDRDKLIHTLSEWIDTCPENTYPKVSPHML